MAWKDCGGSAAGRRNRLVRPIASTWWGGAVSAPHAFCPLLFGSAGRCPAVSAPKLAFHSLQPCERPGPLPAPSGGRCNELLPLRLSSSEERRVGEECVSTFSSRWSPYN